jgi:proteasome lid subunit RPN8/RPN11
MILEESIKTEALTHAKEESPKESVGLVNVIKGRQRYFPCTNLAETPDEHFVLGPEEYAEIEDKGEIVAVIHSHPKTNHAPSPADRVACEKSGLPWHVINPNTENWGYCEPSGFELPYVGREFEILLKDYNRRDQWWNKGENMYLDNFKKEGFKEIKEDEVKYGDLFIMQLESPVPNHGGIYIGDNLVLHHVQGRLSSRDVYKWGGYYHKATSKVLRHESR